MNHTYVRRRVHDRDPVAHYITLHYITGAYTTAIRWHVPDDDRVAMPLLFGYLGLFNALALLPVRHLMSH